MAFAKGRNVQVEISNAEGAAKVVTAVTKAKPPVATSTAHGLLDGSIGYMKDVLGMIQFQDQAVRVDNPLANTFEFQALDSLTYPTYTGGDFIPITSWASFGIITSFTLAGGEGIEADVGTIHGPKDEVEYGGLSAQTMSFNGLAEKVPGQALQILKDAARTQAFKVLRITYDTGEQIVARIQPSLPGLNLEKGNTGTMSFTCAVKGEVLELPAIV